MRLYVRDQAKKIKKMSLADLKAECKQLGLPVGGSKQDLIKQILEHREVIVEASFLL